MVAACTSTRPVPLGFDNDVCDYLGDASRAASIGDSVSRLSPVQLWRTAAGRGTLGAPAVGERVTAVATVDRWIYALDTRTGAVYWRYRSTTPFAAGPVINGDVLFAAGEGQEARVVAIALRNGKRRWQTRVGDVAAPLVVRAGTVYGVTRDGVAFALRAADGRARWRRQLAGVGGLGGATMSGPVAVGPYVAIATATDTLVVLDAQSGRVAARAPLPAGVAAPMSRLDDSTIAAASPAGAVIAVTLPSGRVRWTAATGAPVAGAVAVAHDTVYALTNECTLWAVPARDPSRAETIAVTPPRDDPWSTPCTTAGGPALVRGGVLVATVGGNVIFFDRVARRVLWTRRASRGELRHPPMVRNGQIIVAPVLGEVVSLR